MLVRADRDRNWDAGDFWIHMPRGRSGMVRCRIFRQEFTLEDAIGSHAFAPLEVLPCV
jgi:hypothetical protein